MSGGVVIAGGGPAAIEALLVLRDSAHLDASIELVSPEAEFVYRPLAVAEPFGFGSPPRFSLPWLASLRNASFRLDRLIYVDVDARRAQLQSGAELEYDALLIALGARIGLTLAGTVPFRGVGGDPDFVEVLDRVRANGGELAFVLPHRVRWSLPLYEIALVSAADLTARGVEARLSLITPEPEPLTIFGGEVSAEIARMLEVADIELKCSTDPDEFVKRRTRPEDVAGGQPAIVSLPHWTGPRVGGLPCDDDGFLEVDQYGRVIGAAGVYAAGDCTDFPVKQGGLATEQADSSASAIAADIGADFPPQAFSPVLRGRLYTPGGEPRFLRRDLERFDAGAATIDDVATWWPGAKLFGKRLAPFIAAAARVMEPTP